MTIKSFTSVPDDDVTEVSFELDGEKYTCELRSDADSMLEWSELAGVAASDADLTSMAGVAFVARFFQAMMPVNEYARFRQHLKAHHTAQQMLVDIMQLVNAEMEGVMSAAAERPTKRPARSSAGAGAKAGRTTVRQQPQRRRKAS
jgi:hypothetical protein